MKAFIGEGQDKTLDEFRRERMQIEAGDAKIINGENV